jgi:hypothetical protein
MVVALCKRLTGLVAPSASAETRLHGPSPLATVCLRLSIDLPTAVLPVFTSRNSCSTTAAFPEVLAGREKVIHKRAESLTWLESAVPSYFEKRRTSYASGSIVAASSKMRFRAVE